MSGHDSAIPAGPLRGLAAGALAVAAAALVLLALVEAWQVFARYVLAAPASWTEPVALLLLKVTVMFAAAAAVRRETHFRFALAQQAAGPFGRRLLENFGRLVTAGLGAALAIFGTRLMLDTWSLKTPGAALSAGLYSLPFVVGGALFVAFAFERIFYRDAPAGRGD